MRLAGFFSLLWLAGCAGVLESDKPAREVYLLQPPISSYAAPATHSDTVLMITVSAVPGLDTDRILVLGNDSRLNPVSNAHWSDHIPEIFTSISRRYLSHSGHFAVVRQGSIARPDEWLLELEIQAFYGTQSASENTNGVVLQMEGIVECAGEHHVIRIDKETSTSGDSLSSLVSSHQRVVNDAFPELISGMIDACSED